MGRPLSNAAAAGLVRSPLATCGGRGDAGRLPGSGFPGAGLNSLGSPGRKREVFIRNGFSLDPSLLSHWVWKGTNHHLCRGRQFLLILWIRNGKGQSLEELSALPAAAARAHVLSAEIKFRVGLFRD